MKFSGLVWLANLHKRGFRISRDVAIVLLGDLGFRLAEILTRGMKGSVGHVGRIGTLELKISCSLQNSSNVCDRVLNRCVCMFELFLCQDGGPWVTKLM